MVTENLSKISDAVALSTQTFVAHSSPLTFSFLRETMWPKEKCTGFGITLIWVKGLLLPFLNRVTPIVIFLFECHIFLAARGGEKYLLYPSIIAKSK